ncbi:MAG: phospho-N-acetylmuramoyl-pentapeptide-transferase [Lachnospiraceae bacterium]|nr:phospho-N-acetylmuramoyl-pentapeptide-transferase [Lachnospiraceae bacterium]
MIIQSTAIIPIFISFAISAVLGPFLIPLLRDLKMGQTERELGVKEHLKKAGTPTMGGVIFLFSVLVTSLIFLPRYPKIAPVLFLTMVFGIIGFLDDFLKVVKRDSDGLLPWQKLILQIGATAVFALWLHATENVDLLIRIPFTGGEMLDIGILAYPLLFFAVLGTVNGTNFTDGLDGLASSVTVVAALFFALASVILGAGTAPISAAVAGALMGFLLFNAFPAKIFMGDTGSLALGGYIAGIAYMMNMPLFILIVGLIYVVEVLSVIIQVGYFKISHGKRVFKMAPIHHHFELSGWSETKVVAVFTIITALLSFLALLGL